VKRSVGVDIAVDALEIARQIDHTFLFSGDGDLRSVVEAVKRMGVRVTVVSSIRTKPPMVVPMSFGVRPTSSSSPTR
jgi:uncharacterized LabA/DUF88 family protein